MEKQPASLSRSDNSPNSHPHPTGRPEVELKLLASPAAIERIRGAPVIVRHARNRGVVRKLDTVYYDTPDCALSRQRTSLRVRRSGTRYVQTLKLAEADQAPFVRQQWETPVDTPAPDLTLLPTEISATLSWSAQPSPSPASRRSCRRWQPGLFRRPPCRTLSPRPR